MPSFLGRKNSNDPKKLRHGFVAELKILIDRMNTIKVQSCEKKNMKKVFSRFKRTDDYKTLGGDSYPYAYYSSPNIDKKTCKVKNAGFQKAKEFAKTENNYDWRFVESFEVLKVMFKDHKNDQSYHGYLLKKCIALVTVATDSTLNIQPLGRVTAIVESRQRVVDSFIECYPDKKIEALFDIAFNKFLNGVLNYPGDIAMQRLRLVLRAHRETVNNRELSPESLVFKYQLVFKEANDLAKTLPEENYKVLIVSALKELDGALNYSFGKIFDFSRRTSYHSVGRRRSLAAVAG